MFRLSRCQDCQQVAKIRRLRCGEGLEGQQVNFELDPEFHGEPVQSLEERDTASARWGFGNNSGKAVLDSL